MSLVGNLEDLGLGDAMQIISLSQKSGVLALESQVGSGRIVFRSGLIHSACIGGQPDDLRDLLVKSGLLEGSAFDVIAEHARASNVSMIESIIEKSDLTIERIDDLIRDSVESSVLEMFSWRSGEFSFDVRNGLDSDDPQLVLSSGINAQYLALEGARIDDERARDQGDVGGESKFAPALDESLPSADSIFGVASHSRVASGRAEDTSSALAREPSKSNVAACPLPVVLIDGDVGALDWMKSAIRNDFSRVHTFQQAEQGLARIRQYLIRGELPIVMVSTRIRIDTLSGINGLSDFVARLKTQAFKLAVLGLQEDDGDGYPSGAGPFDHVILRPSGRQLRDQGERLDSTVAQAFAGAIRESLEGSSETSPLRPIRNAASDLMRNLREATGKLQEASSRGEILPVVLDFASELFARVAILIVREEHVYAIAARGIATLEVDPLASSRPVSLQSLTNGWVRNVLDSGKSVQGRPKTGGDRDLLAKFGGDEPDAAYVGAIASGGATIALLYCDQGPDGPEIPDMSGLEVVLQHAGLALDRAALERALLKDEAGTP